MIKSNMGIIVATTLVLGLVGCGTNDSDRGFDTTNNNRNVRNIDVRNDNIDCFDNINYRNRQDNNDMNISATQTSINSDQYPETKAQLIQDAKYKEIQIDPNQMNEFFRQQQGQYSPNQNGQGPNQQQGQYPLDQNGQAPNQQQGQFEQAPTQNQQGPSQKTEQKGQQPQVKNTGNISKYSQQVIDLTNKERSKQGVPALKADTQLSSVAQKKSQDMQKNHYFSHTSPTYGSPFDMMRDFGVKYKNAGENIAQGQQTPQEVVNAWMNSSGHRKNILNKDFTHIGVGFEQEGNHWSQMFIGK
ncbi:hypothetical protein J6TS2_25160 [Heyndrickxia sporothermodurans]|nr:hypothetical protein J6TS2_25160 [Heyndrickxia sporothermodurans]